MVSSIFAKAVTPNPNLPISPSSMPNTLAVADIPITEEDVRPGGGGVLRMIFAVGTFDNPQLGVTNNGTFIGKLNPDADTAFEIQNDGLYRFDIGVEAGDAINIEVLGGPNVEVTDILTLRAQLVVFGVG